MIVRKAVILGSRYGLSVLIGLGFLAYAGAVLESVHAGELFWKAAIKVALADAESASSLQLVSIVLTRLIFVWAGVRVYTASLGLSWDAFSARRLTRQHVIIVAGRSNASDSNPQYPTDKVDMAIAIAEDLVRRKQRVVLCLPSVDETTRARLWQLGITVLSGDIPLTEILAKAGVERARILIAMRDNYEDNIALTRDALSPHHANTKLHCKCLIQPFSIGHRFRAEEFFEQQTLDRIRIFNEAELIAKRLLARSPPDASVAQSDDKTVHLLLIGFGSIGQAVLLQMARQGHYRSEKRPKVTIVDQNVGQHWRSLLKAYRGLEQWVQVETHEARFEDIGPADIKKWFQDEIPVTMIYVCTRNEVANLRITRLVFDSLKKNDPHSSVLQPKIVAIDPPGGVILSDFAKNDDYKGLLNLFSLTQHYREFLLEGVDDTYALQIHQAYCENDDRKAAEDPKHKKGASNLPWEKLPETHRNANRHAADHFETKLRALGLKLVARGQAAQADLTRDEIEIVKRMEHNRWWAERSLDGWEYADIEEQDKENKRHPSMKPYGQLGDEERQKDWDQFTAMISIIEKEKGEIVTRE